MKWYLLAGALIVIVVGVLLALFAAPNQSLTRNTSGNNNTFPIASSTGTYGGNNGSTGGSNSGSSTGTTVSQGGPTTSIATQNGPLTVNDFFHNGITEPDAQNLGNYYLAGSAGYCTKGGICPHGATTTDFNVTYDAIQQFFTIALTDEPIGAARLESEQFLETTLGISQAQMCSLRYYLGTDVYTNSFYGGKNLGFSFCPGTVALPQ
ncbi:MAG: hypothetical protein ACREGR_02125 [Minisyncoccia bacterium]